MKTRLNHKFVDYIPDELDANTIYISFLFSTAVHKCVCGCGNEVVTPITPNDWSVKYNGESVTLDPSVGNWSFQCQSHYWIIENRIVEAPKWSQRKVDIGRWKDKYRKKKYSLLRKLWNILF